MLSLVAKSYYEPELSVSEFGGWAFASLLLALIIAIVVYFTFIKSANADKYEGFQKKLYEFLTFKNLTLEAILKFLYLFVAVYITLSSFALISTSFMGFLAMFVFGNVIARIIFEGTLLIILIYRKLIDISDSLKKEPKKNTEK